MEGRRWGFLGYELLLSLSVLLKGDETAAERVICVTEEFQEQFTCAICVASLSS